MREQNSGLLASGMTSEAVVFYGCTSTELVVIVAGSLVFWAPILALFSIAVFGTILYGLGFILVFVGITAVVAGRILQGMKRGRPEGHYQQIIRLRLGRYNIVRNNFVTFDGQFSLGRTKRVVIMRDE